MTTERSDLAYTIWKDSSERFDYFITGLTVALVAYLGQGILPTRVGFNAGTVELLAVGLLVGSIVHGFLQIQTNVILFGLAHKRLYSEEARGGLIAAAQKGTFLNKSTGEILSPNDALTRAEFLEGNLQDIQAKIQERTPRAGVHYRWRNRLLVAGFLLLVASRILPAYGA